MTKILRFTTRRRFLGLIAGLAARPTAAGLGLGFLTPRVSAAEPTNRSTPSLMKANLEKSPFVYISPLLASGQESRCHAELWFAWLDDRIVVNVASDRWKATALARGLDRARVWVGDHGRWKHWTGNHNEAFRQAPNFVAHVEKLDEAKMIDRLLSVYEEKYPDEIGRWRDSMQVGIADGSRTLLAYRVDP